MTCLNYGLNLLRYSSIGSAVTFMFDVRIVLVFTYFFWFVIILLCLLKWVPDISNYFVFDCFHCFWFSQIFWTIHILRTYWLNIILGCIFKKKLTILFLTLPTVFLQSLIYFVIDSCTRVFPQYFRFYNFDMLSYSHLYWKSYSKNFDKKFMISRTMG